MQSLSAKNVPSLLTIAECLVPPLAQVDEKGKTAFLGIIDSSLMARPASMRRQLNLFLRAIGLFPLFRYGALFHRLSPDKKIRFLEWLEDCPVALIRKGFWGLKTLVYLGYYGNPALGAALGYTPSFRGNERLR